MKFKNRNGKTYNVISKIGDYALLQNVDTLQIVVVWGLEAESWGQGWYFDVSNYYNESNYEAAIELFIKKSYKYESPEFLNYQKLLLLDCLKKAV